VASSADLGPTGGLVWSRPDEWARRRTAEGCIICTSGAPLDVIADLPSAWVTAPTLAPLPGYVCVVSRTHVNEPYELDRNEQVQFWVDSMLVAEAISSVAAPVKMNYEIHGNTLPHLHLHLFPRQVDDPFVGGPIDPRRASVERSAADLDALAAAIGHRLSVGSSDG
jgi:diadenosine tetraphosphate (Ap4A) HIT family hydrolase